MNNRFGFLHGSYRFFPLLILLIAGGCVQFQKISLYEGEEVVPPPPKPEKLSLAVEPVIFSDDSTNLWWDANKNCVQGRVTSEVTYAGDAALEVNWDRNAEGCIWAGFGIGWDDYAGKDISEVMPYAAIEMYVRSKEGKMFGLPVVLTLEDYSEKQAYSYTGNRYFERPVIDEEWQRVVVPLNTFDPNEKGLDPGNIKQLMFELQQSGSMYIDEIRLIFYEPEPQEPWLVEESPPDPLAMPRELFGDAFINNNGWGLVRNDCQTVEITDEEAAVGDRSLHLVWDGTDEDCTLTGMGVSWNKWYPVDMTPVISGTSIQFMAKLPRGEAEELPLSVGLEDYDRNVSLVPLTGRYVEGGRFTTTWQMVTIPLDKLTGAANMENVKDLIFRMEGAGEIYIDQVQLVEETR